MSSTRVPKLGPKLKDLELGDSLTFRIQFHPPEWTLIKSFLWRKIQREEVIWLLTSIYVILKK
jgi:hypothetical protein